MASTSQGAPFREALIRCGGGGRLRTSSIQFNSIQFRVRHTVGDGQRRVPGRVRSRLEGYGIFFVLIIVAQNRGGQAELPPLSLKTMEGIPTIEEYWEMLPRWRRGRINPLLIMLHGNQYTRRGSEYQLVDAPLSVFAEPSTLTGTVLRDFQERSKQSGSIGDWDLFSREKRARERFRRSAEVNHWSMTIIAPVLKRTGPWSPEDLALFAKRIQTIHNASRSTYLVGVSTGGMAALRTLEVAGVPSPFAALAVASPGCPNDNRQANAGFKSDPACTPAGALPPIAVVKTLAENLKKTRVPILIYQGTDDNRVKPRFQLELAKEINGRAFKLNELSSERVQVYTRLLHGGAHNAKTWSRAFLYVSLLRTPDA